MLGYYLLYFGHYFCFPHFFDMIMIIIFLLFFFVEARGWRMGMMVDLLAISVSSRFFLMYWQLYFSRISYEFQFLIYAGFLNFSLLIPHLFAFPIFFHFFLIFLSFIWIQALFCLFLFEYFNFFPLILDRVFL